MTHTPSDDEGLRDLATLLLANSVISPVAQTVAYKAVYGSGQAVVSSQQMKEFNKAIDGLAALISQKITEARIEDVEYIIEKKPTRQWLQHRLVILKELQATLTTKQDIKEKK